MLSQSGFILQFILQLYESWNRILDKTDTGGHCLCHTYGYLAATLRCEETRGELDFQNQMSIWERKAK